MSIPVVLFVYNRPVHLTKTLHSIKKEKKISKIYFFIDGPKTNATKKEINKINRCIKIIKNINWVQKEIFIQNFNIGIKKTLFYSTRIVFEKRKHNFIILLEDDDIILPGFYDFMNKCSKKFNKNNKIFSITGYNFSLPDNAYKTIQGDHFFLNYTNTWSLGIWRRSWKLWKKEIKNLDISSKRKIFSKILKNNDFILYDALFEGLLKKNNAGSTYFYSVWRNKKLTIFPKFPLIKNIGMDGSGENFIPSTKFLNSRRFSKNHKINIINQEIKSNVYVKNSIYAFLNLGLKKKLFYRFCPFILQLPIMRFYVWFKKKNT